MAESNTPRFGLRQWGAGTDGPSRSEFNASFAAIETLGAIYADGTLAGRPSAGVVGRTYTVVGDGTAANNGMQFFDTGTSWVPLNQNLQNALVTPSAANVVPMSVRAYTSQTADLQQWLSATSAVLASISSVGKGTFASLAAGATALSSTLSVAGAATLASTLGVTGLSTLSGGLAVLGNESVSGTLSAAALSLSGNATITGNITLNGQINGVTIAPSSGPGSGSFTALTVSGGSTVAALSASGLLSANGGIQTTNLNATGQITGQYRSTTNRSDGNPKTQLNADGTGRFDGLVPPGTVMMWAGSGTPAGYLLCDGTSYLTTAQPDLYAAIGTKYGGGSGSFNVPNFAGRFPMGDSGTTYPVGSTGGSASVTLVEGNLPPHLHDIAHSHTGANTASGGSHDHQTYHINVDGQSSATFRSGTTDGRTTDNNLVQASGSHTHTVSIPAYSGSSGPGNGTSSPVSTLPPYVTVRFIIKA